MKTSIDWREARQTGEKRAACACWNCIAKAGSRKPSPKHRASPKATSANWSSVSKTFPTTSRPKRSSIHKRAGRKPSFSQEHKGQVVALVERGGVSLGLPGPVWTLKSLQNVVRQELLGLRMGQTWLWETLHAKGDSCHKPERLAKEQNRRAVAGFKGGWSRLQKGHSDVARR